MTSRNYTQDEQHSNDIEEREIFDVMRNENADLVDGIFTFRNVLLLALVLGVAIVICYKLGAM